SADTEAAAVGPSEGSEPASGASPSTRRRRSRGGRNRRKSSEAAPSDEVDGSPDGQTSDRQGVGSGSAADSSGAETAASPKTKKPSSKKSAAKKSSGEAASEASPADQDGDAKETDDDGSTSSSSRRRRRRRRSGDGPGDASDAPDTVVKVREPRPASESITSVQGSTRMEAKKQRRREGREAGRRRAPILSESEFLARRESVERVMVVRQHADVTQIAVLEDDVLVEHYVALETQSSLIGNVYLGRVQNVLPSMEAAFIDIGKGRNAVLYAGEVNWDLIGDRNQPRRIENALKSGQQILVQVSKDPVGHKGARLTSQISLPGRYLVYVPGGGSSGISRKLPDTERNRLKNLLKEILPDESGVIIRTAAEGASEEELTRDVTRLTSRWDEIEQKVKGGKAPALLYAEPDITLKVVRDLFTEDFAKLVVSGDEAWEIVNDYVSYVAPDLTERLERYDGDGDVFADYRVDEQIAKALERKVWLPSGGSLVIDRTEAMTVVDVNTGKFTGSGGNLEQTVTANNLEAAEEMVRQLRLRDIGGIIVIDFIDMVLENNRDLVLRRLVECLGRDRTRHQVAEVTSLGLVQMTRKRIGTGLVEAFSVPCEHCHGRGVVIEGEPVRSRSDDQGQDGRPSSKRSSGRQRGGAKSDPQGERTDPLAAERHSAAAAATAAIAAALHPETKHHVEPGDVAAIEATDAILSLAMPGDPVRADESPAPEPPTKGAKTKKTSPTKKPAAKKPAAKKPAAKKPAAKNATGTAKKSAAKKSTARKGTDLVSGPTPEPVSVSS
ncbi:MAG: Rne/Rng family ribonuclease, partial [Nocardioidaceae bacterium]